MEERNTLCGQNAEFIMLKRVAHVVTTEFFKRKWVCLSCRDALFQRLLNPNSCLRDSQPSALRRQLTAVFRVPESGATVDDVTEAARQGEVPWSK
jgi:hypothetical protein